jgi:hypothetical protein
MTTTRINHTGHDHANTTTARTACRKAMAATPAPVFHMVVVGNGKVRHTAYLGHDGVVLGARCGAGLGRGVRKNSPLTAWISDVNDVNCNRCR